ncbi:hypothetical protein M404DRAFT_477248 [Pisolithus tinctorius Marx 270]|uniref:Uncharacterized protein n=1 Tax=Pisolithus tinctorius Marx 270 TaxID=870435 RepID=A0A0C3KY44_PISTI|nr:hypothetical protein M404DRAFT_477248 [Pisolithus tinctorius Marx 270]
MLYAVPLASQGQGARNLNLTGRRRVVHTKVEGLIFLGRLCKTRLTLGCHSIHKVGAYLDREVGRLGPGSECPNGAGYPISWIPSRSRSASRALSCGVANSGILCTRGDLPWHGWMVRNPFETREAGRRATGTRIRGKERKEGLGTCCL